MFYACVKLANPTAFYGARLNGPLFSENIEGRAGFEPQISIAGSDNSTNLFNELGLIL